jgi:prepilin-type N-terminal cleavage/methylation domain-containing protein
MRIGTKMIRKPVNEESGYSLVEVMVSIFILAIAIIPMVGMFDMGLNAATRGSNYDKARALASTQLEQAASFSYGTVRTDFPNAPCTDGEYDNFRYAIRKQYVVPNDADGFDNAEDDSGMMQLTVEVGWGGVGFDDTTYTATTLKVR